MGLISVNTLEMMTYLLSVSMASIQECLELPSADSVPIARYCFFSEMVKSLQYIVAGDEQRKISQNMQSVFSKILLEAKYKYISDRIYEHHHMKFKLTSLLIFL